MPEPSVLLVLALVTLTGSVVQAVVGLGLGLLLAPIAATVAPGLVPELPLWLALLLSGASVLGERHAIDWPAIAWSLPMRVPGTVIGVWLVLRSTEGQIGVAVAVMVLVAVALSVRVVDVRITRSRLLAAGLASGVAGTATSIGGPPIAVLFQSRRPSEVRATLAVFFFVGVVLSLAGLGIAGELERTTFLLALVLSPAVVLGLLLGTRLRDRLPREQFRRAVLVVCATSALVLLARSLL